MAAAVIAVLVIGGVLLLAMIGVSWYGWITLPADALVPIHFGAGYNNFVSKRPLLTYRAFAGTPGDPHQRDRSRPHRARRRRQPARFVRAKSHQASPVAVPRRSTPGVIILNVPIGGWSSRCSH